MVHRILCCNAFAALADDDGQFGFVVNGGGNTGGRQRDGCAGADDRLGDLGEDDRIARHAVVGLGAAVKAAAGELCGVRMVVFTHAKNISARHGQWCGDVNIRQSHHWQQSRQRQASRLDFQNGQGSPRALINCQIKRLDLPAVS